MASPSQGADTDHKQRGNALFGSGDYAAAVAEYSAGIVACTTAASGAGAGAGAAGAGAGGADGGGASAGAAAAVTLADQAKLRATLLCNRAVCHLKLGAWQAAADDATACLHADNSMHKALYRRAVVSGAAVLRCCGAAVLRCCGAAPVAFV